MLPQNGVWEKTLTLLRGQMTQATYDYLLAGSSLAGVQKPLMSDDPDLYRIEVQSDLAADLLVKRQKDPITRALAAVVGSPVEVEFTVAPDGQPEAEADSDGRLNVRDRRKPKRLYIDNVFFRGGYAAKVGPYGIAIYAALAMHADNYTQEAWPSYNTLADLTGMSRRQVIRKVAELAELNLVAIETRINSKKFYDSNVIALLDDSEWKKID